MGREGGKQRGQMHQNIYLFESSCYPKNMHQMHEMHQMYGIRKRERRPKTDLEYGIDMRETARRETGERIKKVEEG